MLDTMVAGDSLCSNLATLTARELSLLPSLITTSSGSPRMGEEELLSTGPPCVVPTSSFSGTAAGSLGLEVGCGLFTAGESLMTGSCGGPVLSGGAALQPSGSVRRADLERTRDAAPALCGLMHVFVARAALKACVDASGCPDDVVLSRPTELPFSLSEVSMESEEERVHSKEEPAVGPSATEEEVKEECWNEPVFLLRERNMSSSECGQDAADEVEEAIEGTPDTILSAWLSNLRISCKALVLPKESSVLACREDSNSLSLHLVSVFKALSDSNLSPSWMVLWLLAQLLSFRWLGCSSRRWEVFWGCELGAVLRLLAAVSDAGEALVCSGKDTGGQRLSMLSGIEILESTDSKLDRENSPLWGLPPTNIKWEKMRISKYTNWLKSN